MVNLPERRLNRPKTARFDATLWISSGGSPMTPYRTICVRTQGPTPSGRQGCSATGRTTTVRPISDEKKDVGTLPHTEAITLEHWPV
jgi:hypothetical protein